MKKYLLPFILLVSPAYAITVIDDFNTSETPIGTTYNLSASLSGNSGNTNNQKIGINSKAIHNDKDKFILGKVGYNYGKNSGVKNIDKFLGHLRIGFKLSDSYQEESYIQYQTDQFSKLKYRYLIGSGGALSGRIGELEYRVGLGLFYEILQKDITVYRATRLNSYSFLKYNLSQVASLRNTLYYQPNISSFSDRKVMNSSSINAKINDYSSLEISVKYEYDSLPAAGVNSSDISYSSSIVFSF